MERENARRLPGFCDVFDLQINARGFSAFNDIEVRSLRSSVLHQAEIDPFNLVGVIPIFACKFNPVASNSHILATCDEIGNVAVHNVKKPCRTTTQCRTHNNAIFDVAWMPTGRKLLTMSGDHTSRLLDVGKAEIKAEALFQGHTKSVKTADFLPSDPAVFATGARDGNILIWDSRSCKKVEAIYGPDQTITKAGGRPIGVHCSSVTAVLFKDQFNLISCGSSDNIIRIYDMRKTHCAWKESLPKSTLLSKRHGFTDLKLNPQRTKLYASNINSNIVCFNLNSERQDPIAEFTGHLAATFYVKTNVSADGRYLLSGSSDHNLYIWNTEKAELRNGPVQPMMQLSSHTGEVTGVDFIQHGRTVVASGADDGTVRIWTPQPPDLDKDTKFLISQMCDLSIKKPAGIMFKKSALRTPPRKALIATQLQISGGKRKLAETSPVKSEERNLSPRVGEFHSPTMNLPNYVLEGTGPSHSCPRPKHKENKQDWLTEMKHRSATNKSPQSLTQVKRRLSMQDKKRSSRTLLNYYKKSNKVTDDSLQKN